MKLGSNLNKVSVGVGLLAGSLLAAGVASAWALSQDNATPTDPNTPIVVTPSGMATPHDESLTTTTPIPEQSTGDIGLDEAIRVALVHAGLSADDVTIVQSVRGHADFEDGVAIYDIEFYYNAVEYDYEIRASDGAILSFDHDIDKFNMGGAQATAPAPTGAQISEAQAMQIALARVPGATSSDIRIHLDKERGRLVWEGEIRKNGWEYEFEIDATTGAITEWDVERDD